MTTEELLRIVLGQARQNGFEFRRWFVRHIRHEWPGGQQAIQMLAVESRYYALVFSHDFAQAFWHEGRTIQFIVPQDTYQRRNARGEIVEVRRKAFTRRTAKPHAWKYHLGRMAEADHPLVYLRKFLLIEEDLKPVPRPKAGVVNLAASAQPNRRLPEPPEPEEEEFKADPLGLDDLEVNDRDDLD